MRLRSSVLAGITLLVVLTTTSLAPPASAQTPPVDVPVQVPDVGGLPELPVDVPVQVPDIAGLVDLPVDLPALSALGDLVGCATGAMPDLSSPTGLVGPVQCILEKIVGLLASLLGALGIELPSVPGVV